jgi:hypothetical protein
MIRYKAETNSQGPHDETTCFMVDLWNERGAASCRAIILMPDGEKDIQVWIIGTVVAIPDIGLSFRKHCGAAPEGISSLIRKNAGVGIPMAAALAMTIEVMEKVLDREREHNDDEANLAYFGGGTMDFSDYCRHDGGLPF